MINILELIPDRSDGTSFYRGSIPLNHLAKTYPKEINITPLLDYEFYGNWWTITKYHILFSQRPCTDKEFKIIRNAKNLGVKVWVDYDDNLLNLNEDNQVVKVYEENNCNHYIKEILKIADVVSVSTPYLKKSLSVFNKNIEVIPNALANEILGGAPEWNKNKTIAWRGGQNHHNDMLEYEDVLTKFWQENKDWTFNLYGYKPEDNWNGIKHKHFQFCDNIFIYLKTITEDNSSIAIVPMVDNIFNRSKSNIAWIEHTLSGSVVLAPDWEEWKKPGVINYTSKEDFVEKLNSMKEMDLKENLNQSWSSIQQDLILEKVNKLRYMLIMRS